MRLPRIDAVVVAFLLGLAAAASATPPGDGPTVRGYVHDPQGRPLAGVKVTVRESTEAAVTGADGRFVLVLPGALPSVTLRFEDPLREPAVRELRPSGAPLELDVALVPRLRVAESVTVTASRLDIPARDNPAATTVVTGSSLALVPRGIGADETLLTVPGVKVDNQANAYTFSGFVYTRYEGISLPGDLSGNALPNSPRHQGVLEAVYTWRDRWVAAASVQALSRAYVDATNATWIDGYALLGLRLARSFTLGSRRLEAFVSGRNLADVEYIAFTEPDPDGNSYHPGPEREVFAGLRLGF